MSRKYDNVIVFGPTGTIGGLVAAEAQKQGAKVWLAMRDTSKAISAIPSHLEESGNFTRVQADITDPPSVTKAIATSGAKAAYLYLIHGDMTFGRGALQAMREGGVEYIVFLSGYNVKGQGEELRAIPKENWIPFVHAQVEIAVEDVGFPYFTALRPAWFASNFFKNYLDRSSKPNYKAPMLYEDAVFDNIAPEDVGLVGGRVLAERPSDAKKETIYLCGPELRSVKESWELIKKITGRHDIDTAATTEAAFLQRFALLGLPDFVGKYFMRALQESKAGFAVPDYQIGVENVRKYAGKEPTSFADYLEAHKEEWKAL
ncbi:NmrA domain-containing protein [Mycena indigotica]|uniref:NmrA domain-containing protein n=1 Tax=Mycena indigotica TaxID=2126181 RepID=A0A8H6WEV3_9AGAR|nr:NmrA domain-containing protein [Mycena indigotica]KAF7309849.1 NmrA domain-containing protein [Mycena indigotica]